MILWPNRCAARRHRHPMLPRMHIDAGPVRMPDPQVVRHHYLLGLLRARGPFRMGRTLTLMIDHVSRHHHLLGLFRACGPFRMGRTLTLVIDHAASVGKEAAGAGV